MDIKTPKTKVCTKCGKRKALDEFADNKRCKFGKEGTCKKCKNKTSLDFYVKNREKLKARSRAYGKENRQAISKRMRQHRKDNIERYKEAKRLEVKRMPDGYIAAKLGLLLKDVPPALIEAKRIQLQIKRFIKNGHE